MAKKDKSKDRVPLTQTRLYQYGPSDKPSASKQKNARTSSAAFDVTPLPQTISTPASKAQKPRSKPSTTQKTRFSGDLETPGASSSRNPPRRSARLRVVSDEEGKEDPNPSPAKKARFTPRIRDRDAWKDSPYSDTTITAFSTPATSVFPSTPSTTGRTLVSPTPYTAETSPQVPNSMKKVFTQRRPLPASQDDDTVSIISINSSPRSSPDKRSASPPKPPTNLSFHQRRTNPDTRINSSQPNFAVPQSPVTPRKNKRKFGTDAGPSDPFTFSPERLPTQQSPRSPMKPPMTPENKLILSDTEDPDHYVPSSQTPDKWNARTFDAFQRRPRASVPVYYDYGSLDDTSEGAYRDHENMHQDGAEIVPSSQSQSLDSEWLETFIGSRRQIHPNDTTTAAEDPNATSIAINNQRQGSVQSNLNSFHNTLSSHSASKRRSPLDTQQTAEGLETESWSALMARTNHNPPLPASHQSSKPQLQHASSSIESCRSSASNASARRGTLASTLDEPDTESWAAAKARAKPWPPSSPPEVPSEPMVRAPNANKQARHSSPLFSPPPLSSPLFSAPPTPASLRKRRAAQRITASQSTHPSSSLPTPLEVQVALHKASQASQSSVNYRTSPLRPVQPVHIPRDPDIMAMPGTQTQEPTWSESPAHHVLDFAGAEATYRRHYDGNDAGDEPDDFRNDTQARREYRMMTQSVYEPSTGDEDEDEGQDEDVTMKEKKNEEGVVSLQVLHPVIFVPPTPSPLVAMDVEHTPVSSPVSSPHDRSTSTIYLTRTRGNERSRSSSLSSLRSASPTSSTTNTNTRATEDRIDKGKRRATLDSALNSQSSGIPSPRKLDKIMAGRRAPRLSKNPEYVSDSEDDIDNDGIPASLAEKFDEIEEGGLTQFLLSDSQIERERAAWA